MTVETLTIEIGSDDVSPAHRTVDVQVIDASHGERPAYRLDAHCTVCSWSGQVRREKGMRPNHVMDCPRCECLSVQAGNTFCGEDL